jgi:hypothetical protein
MRTALVALAIALAAPAAPAAAQQASGGAMPESYRNVQLKALQLQRRMLLTIADSMPERLYADRAFETQGRDFAHQVHHAAGAVAMLGTRVMGAPAAGVPDTSAATFTTRAGLKQYVNGIYDWAENALKGQTPAGRAEAVSLFGNQMPRWQVWDELHMHTVWTAGSIVANFRKHGMAMPGFGFF